MVICHVTPTPGDMGSAPMRPAANWAFWSRRAVAMSSVVMRSWLMRSGLSQTRME